MLTRRMMMAAAAVSGGTGTLWTPSQINTELWLDANDPDTIQESGGDVTQWDDKSGNGYHATVPAGNSQSVAAGAFNGNDAFDFQGSDSYFELQAALSLVSQVSIFAAFQRASTGITSLCIGTSTSGTAPYGIWWYTDDVIYSALEGGGFSTHGTLTTTGLFVSSLIRYSDDTVSAFIDGTLVSNEAAGGVAGDLNYIGARGDDYHQGLIGEVVVVNQELSEADRQRMEGYLAHKWGTAGDLPSSHPYKNEAPTV